MIAFIDADSITYSAACSVERRYYLSHHDGEEYQYKKEVPHIEEGFELCYDVGELWMAKSNADNLLKKIIERTECYDFEVYLTGDSNFRDEVASDYKDNRKSLRRPQYLQEVRQHLVDCWGAEIVEGMEADDKVSIEAWKIRYSELPQSNPNYVVCHIDKDLDQIPGLHYNWVRDEKYLITVLEAAYNYWTQVLTGDVSDNVPGIKGVGPAKASKILEGASTIQDMEDKVKEAYLLDGRKRKISDEITLKRLEKNCKLLYLLRSEEMKQKVLISIPMQEYVSRGLLGGVEVREEIDLAIIEYTGKMGFLLDKKDNFDDQSVDYLYEIWYEKES